MLHAGPADWKSCFYFPTATPNTKWVLETECPHPTLTPARRQDRTSDPGPVTEPFCPPAGKGSLGPESHWGSVAKEKNRAASTLRDVSPSTRPREGSGKCHPESREEKPPSPHHDLGDPIYGHVWKSGLGQHSDTWTADLGQQNAQPTVGTPLLGGTLELPAMERQHKSYSGMLRTGAEGGWPVQEFHPGHGERDVWLA